MIPAIVAAEVGELLVLAYRAYKLYRNAKRATKALELVMQASSPEVEKDVQWEEIPTWDEPIRRFISDIAFSYYVHGTWLYGRERSLTLKYDTHTLQEAIDHALATPNYVNAETASVSAVSSLARGIAGYFSAHGTYNVSDMLELANVIADAESVTDFQPLAIVARDPVVKAQLTDHFKKKAVESTFGDQWDAIISKWLDETLTNEKALATLYSAVIPKEFKLVHTDTIPGVIASFLVTTSNYFVPTTSSPKNGMLKLLCATLPSGGSEDLRVSVTVRRSITVTSTRSTKR